MFNMKTSDLFKRAKQLADLEGSDFISWNEAVNCINEANVSLYEKLINMGDNSFVSSFRTAAEETELPKDFWQLKGVYQWNNGNLLTINRRADNSGLHHLSYELRNGKLYLFGNPNDVLVEYFPRPKKLYFQPNSVAVGIDTDKTYLDCNKHTFLYEDTNVSNQETLSVIDLDGIKTAKDFIQIAHDSVVAAYLTDNFVFIVTDSDIIVYDMMSGYSATIASSYAPVVTESGKEYLMGADGNIYYFHVGNGTFSTSLIKSIPEFAGGSYYACDDGLEDFFYVADNNVLHNDVDINMGECKIIYSDKKCYCLGHTGYGVIDENNNVSIIDNATGLNVGFIGIDERTGFGYCSKKYGNYYVNPYCEDTPLNYPNSMYFQIIAYILAIMFKSKQGADVSLLSSQLAMAEQTFEDTLGSDSFQFPRIGNVYK